MAGGTHALGTVSPCSATANKGGLETQETVGGKAYRNSIHWHYDISSCITGNDIIVLFQGFTIEFQEMEKQNPGGRGMPPKDIYSSPVSTDIQEDDPLVSQDLVGGQASFTSSSPNLKLTLQWTIQWTFKSATSLQDAVPALSHIHSLSCTQDFKVVAFRHRKFKERVQQEAAQWQEAAPHGNHFVSASELYGSAHNPFSTLSKVPEGSPICLTQLVAKDVFCCLAWLSCQRRREKEAGRKRARRQPGRQAGSRGGPAAGKKRQAGGRAGSGAASPAIAAASERTGGPAAAGPPTDPRPAEGESGAGPLDASGAGLRGAKPGAESALERGEQRGGGAAAAAAALSDSDGAAGPGSHPAAAAGAAGEARRQAGPRAPLPAAPEAARPGWWRRWRRGSSSSSSARPVDPESGAPVAATAAEAAPPAAPPLAAAAAAAARSPKGAGCGRMVRLGAELLLLLLGLLLLGLHITLLRAGPPDGAPANHSQRRPETLHADSLSSPDSSFTLNSEDRRSYPDPQAAHRPFAKQRFRQENGQTSLQRDGPQSFLLDLPNFPDLSNADINGQNPNIQVTIEVVDGPDSEPEKDLQKESSKPSWPAPSPDWRNWWQRSAPTVTRMSSGDQDYKYDSMTEDSNFLNPLGGWDRHASSHRTFESKEHPEYAYARFRGKLCLHSFTSNHVTCDRPNCPGIEDTFRTAATEVSLLAGSEEFNATKLFEVDTDSCERWMSCKSEFLKKYMHKVVNDLPACPCAYPTEVAYSTADIYDRMKRKNFRWKDASGPKEKLEIYKPTARYCIRSMLSLESTTLAAQHCCYDDTMQLITRGKGAGTPNLISIEFSAELHYKVDVLPWIICKGDWSRYNEARPPNNGQKCTENPSEEDYYKQFQEAREY
ncbi:isthmin-1 [Sphaerodactylus townsendi]|uniref:isthmin-1 n=1 Tax=Sphaerodactylus townsendi TaxID=933632 RepID=UPI0020268068|nr:isthmin-1 [Sphaerodactylus townsendi]